MHEPALGNYGPPIPPPACLGQGKKLVCDKISSSWILVLNNHIPLPTRRRRVSLLPNRPLHLIAQVDRQNRSTSNLPAVCSLPSLRGSKQTANSVRSEQQRLLASPPRSCSLAQIHPFFFLSRLLPSSNQQLTPFSHPPVLLPSSPSSWLLQ